MPRKLYRSNQRKIAGVCAGIAEYFDIDPTLVRVVAVISLLWGGAGGLAYLIAWAMLPKSGQRGA